MAHTKNHAPDADARPAAGWRRWFVPSPMDAWLVTTVIYWGYAAIASVFGVERYTGSLGVPLVTGTLTILLAVCLMSVYRIIPLVMFGMLAITCAGGFAVFLYAIVVLHHWGFSSQSVHEDWHAQTSLLRASTEYSLASWTVAAVAWIFACRSPRCRSSAMTAAAYGKRMASRIWHRRLRISIIAVALLFPLVIARNILDPGNLSTYWLTNGLFAGFVAVCCVTVGVVAIHLLMLALAKPKWRPALFALFLVLTAGCLCWLMSQNYLRFNSRKMADDLSIAVSLMLFMGVLLTLPTARQRTPHLRLSVAGILPAMAIMVPAVLMISTFELASVAKAYVQSPRSFAEGKWIPLSRAMKNIQRATGGTAKVTRHGVELIIDSSTPKNCILGISQNWPPGASALYLQNVSPGIEIASINPAIKCVFVDGGTVTSRHLRAFKHVRSASFGDLRFEIGEEPFDLPVNCTISSSKPISGFTELMKRKQSRRAGFLDLQFPLSTPDWQAVVQETSCQIWLRLSDLPTEAFSNPIAGDSKKLSHIRLRHQGELSEAIPRLARVIDGSIAFEHYGQKQTRLVWLLEMFVPGYRGWAVGAETLPSTARNMNDFGWAYGSDTSGRITHTWLPSPHLLDEYGEELTELRELRLDRSGIVEIDTFQMQDFQSDQTFPLLERLYLSSAHPQTGFAFLSKFPNLKHLQLPSMVRPTKSSQGFKLCQQLESIQFSGMPSALTIRELEGLSKLQRIAIVVGDAEAESQEIEAIRKRLPNVVVEASELVDYEPDLSPRLIRHREQLRRELFETIGVRD